MILKRQDYFAVGVMLLLKVDVQKLNNTSLTIKSCFKKYYRRKNLTVPNYKAQESGKKKKRAILKVVSNDVFLQLKPQQ